VLTVRVHGPWLDLRASAVRLRPRRRRADSVRASRRPLPRRRHSAGDQQGWSQLVAGAALGRTCRRAGRTHSVAQAAGVANDVRRRREKPTTQGRYEPLRSYNRYSLEMTSLVFTVKQRQGRILVWILPASVTVCHIDQSQSTWLRRQKSYHTAGLDLASRPTTQAICDALSSVVIYGMSHGLRSQFIYDGTRASRCVH